jgi:hypothetical protein
MNTTETAHCDCSRSIGTGSSGCIALTTCSVARTPRSMSASDRENEGVTLDWLCMHSTHRSCWYAMQFAIHNQKFGNQSINHFTSLLGGFESAAENVTIAMTTHKHGALFGLDMYAHVTNVRETA